jgi:hypothetical protein
VSIRWFNTQRSVSQIKCFLGFENLHHEKDCVEGWAPSEVHGSQQTRRVDLQQDVCWVKKKDDQPLPPKSAPLLCFHVCLSCTDVSNGWMTLQAALSQQPDEQSLSRRRSYLPNAFKSERAVANRFLLNNINERSYWSSSKGIRQGRRFNLCRNSSVRPQGSLHRCFQVTPSSSS